jgi:osmotically inducible protein OsmC
MKRHATVHWQGAAKQGKGYVTMQSGVLKDSPYAYQTRYENEPGTNPEELIAAAHASCFSMKLSFNFSKAGFPSESIDTRCDITFDTEKNEIVTSHLTVKANVPGISKQRFDEEVEDARKNCPVSKLLKAEITCRAELEVEQAVK